LKTLFSGTLISDVDVLLGARIVNGVPASKLKVRIGDMESKVAFVFIRKDYKPDTQENNLAMLRLTEPFDTSKPDIDVAPIRVDYVEFGEIANGFGKHQSSVSIFRYLR